MSRVRKLREAIRSAGLADAPVMLAMETLASMPEAKAFRITPILLKYMLCESQPGDYATRLFERAGYCVEMPLADLAQLAQYDATLREVVAAVILCLDETCSPPGTPPDHPTDS